MPEKKTVEVEVNGQKQTIEVFDAKAVETLITTKETTFNTEKAALEAKAKEASDALEKIDKTNKDFDGLRTAKEAAEKTLKEKQDAHAKEIGELRTKPLVEHKDNLSKLFAGSDKNVNDKIKHHMEKSLASMPETTKEEIDAKVKAAYQLSVGSDYKDDFVQRVISSAGGGPAAGAAGGVSKDIMDIAPKFGLTQKDFDAAKEKGII